jgi:hypothetical protein
MRPCTLAAEDGRMLGLLEDDGRIEDRPLHMKEVKGNNGFKLNRNDVAIFVLVHVIIMYHFPRDCGRASSWRQDGVPSYWTMIGNRTTETRRPAMPKGVSSRLSKVFLLSPWLFF